jgi:hypothetical protein
MPSSGMLRRAALVRTDVSKEPSPSIVRVTRIGELGTTLTVSSNRRTMRRNSLRIRLNRAQYLKLAENICYNKNANENIYLNIKLPN